MLWITSDSAFDRCFSRHSRESGNPGSPEYIDVSLRAQARRMNGRMAGI